MTAHCGEVGAVVPKCPFRPPAELPGYVSVNIYRNPPMALTRGPHIKKETPVGGSVYVLFVRTFIIM